MALKFRDSEALVVALASGVCPADVAAGAARVARAGDGGVIVEPARPVPGPTLEALRAVGVEVDAAGSGDSGRDVRCWAEAIAPVRAPIAAIPSLVLFVTAHGQTVIDVAAELVRLACDRLELMTTGDGGGVIRAIDPPAYTVERALDRDGDVRCFAPSPAGQDAVWTELGFHHPLAARVAAAPGTLVLIARDGWRALPIGTWRGLDAALDVTLPVPPVRVAAIAAWPRRTIELRLARGRREVASLWLIRRGGAAAIDDLIAHVPEDVVARLTFAVATTDDEPIVIVRARASRQPPPDLGLPGEAYAPLADLPDVYAPADATVEPPLRRDRLRALLGATGSDVVWLAPIGPGSAQFRVERIADHAFAPLAEWADYVLHAHAPAFAPWLRATELVFAPFVTSGSELVAPILAPPPALTTAPEGKRKKSRAPVPDAVPDEPAAEVPPPPAPAPRPPRVRDLARDAELIALETQFVELDAPGDAPARLALFSQLAAAYARLGRRRDAGLCAVRAVWEAPPDAAAGLLDAWIARDAAVRPAALDELLALPAPDADDVRRVAAIAATARPAAVGDPHRVQRWLDAHDGVLDARTQWLARLGLARLAGGDPLGLAHARDRILARLAGGLSVEHELPGLLRLAERRGALGHAGERLTRALDDLAQRLAKTRRRRSITEAPAQLTGAYVQCQLAYGYARVGEPGRARERIAAAHAALAPVLGDPVHAYLAAAFTARVEQAIAGAPPEAPLPEPITAQLAALDRMARYKVDRLREASHILEPVARLDARITFSLHHDVHGREFDAVRAIGEPRARRRALAAIIDTAEVETGERARLLDGVLDALLELGEADAVPLVQRAWPLIADVEPARRATLYAEALVVAGHFGRADLVPRGLDRLAAAIRDVTGDDLARALHVSVRALRRIGLRDDIARLLVDAEHALPAAAPGALRGRLALAAGLAYLGDTARAEPILAQASQAISADFQALADPRRTGAGAGPGPMRPLELTRALALAYAYMPFASALAGIATLGTYFKDVTDIFGTNSHYCLSVLHFVESLLLAITSEDLAIGEAGRRFVEDDEHLIRRRLHRDLAAAT